ncbi:LOW QUALITY PROTEIN: hypothetical protein HID58_062159, partial [Brassica napus]
SRLSREGKGKDVVTSPSPASGSPLDEFDLIHRDALRDTENMSLSQRLLVADSHRKTRKEAAGRMEASGDSGTSGSRNSGKDQSDASIGSERSVDWESRLPCVLRPRKSRLSLFTRKQQKLLDEAREMDGVPDLSALLKGKLQLLSKKSTPANVPESTSSEGCGASEGGGASKERASSLVDEGFGAEPSASSPRKKKKSKKAKRKATDEAPLKKTASLDEASEGEKEKGRKEEPREGATSSIDQDEAPAGGREGAAEDLVETDPAEAVPEDRPKKKTKKKFVDAEPRPYAVEATLVDVAMRGRVSPETPSEKKRKVSTRGSGSGSEPAASEKSAPDSSARKGSRSEGSLAKRGRIEFPERVQFSYD